MSENIKPLSRAVGYAYLAGDVVLDLSDLTFVFNP